MIARRWRRAIAHGIVLLSCAAPAAAEDLGPLGPVVQRYNVPTRALSVMVQAVDAPTPVLALNVDVPRNPASTIKLLTTFVALDILGPTHTWRTEVYAQGPLADGVLDGDLLLKGYGDPYLVEENLWKMLGELRRAGLREIKGNLAIDDSYFAPDDVDPGAFDGQPFRLYNVRPNALMVNFKALTFHFAPRTDGRGVRIWSVPELPNLTITNALRLEDGPCQGVLQSFDMQVPEPVAADHVVFDGRYQRTCGEQTLPRTALQPATYAYGLFKTLWAQWGGTIAGGVRRAAQASRRAPLLTWYSPPLADLIRPLNKWSNNVMADALLYALADTGYTPPLHAAQGADVIRRYLAEHDIPDAGLVLDNGSGLSRQTRVSARTMLSLLRHAYRSRYMSEYVSSLSIAGVDGTMRRRFRRAPERGWMHLKTGHLSNVAAVAGYVQAQSGRTYVAVLLLNGPTGAGTPLIEALLSWIYRL